MKGNFIDTIRFAWKPFPKTEGDFFFLDTAYGKIRVLDTKEKKTVVINVPDGPNVIEHQLPLIKELSKNYRVVCFEYPGIGFSFPNAKFDYSYKNGAGLLLQVMDLLEIQNAVLLFSCSNGFYGIQAVSDYPDRIKHIFLSQTPSVTSMIKWTSTNIPSVLKIPLIGQIINSVSSKKLAEIWYQYALPKDSVQRHDFVETAHKSLTHGGCFCLSSLVQGLIVEEKTTLNMADVPATLVWGTKDFSHRKTDKYTIQNHIKDCEIIEFENCGHFPELEDTNRFVQLIKERIK